GGVVGGSDDRQRLHLRHRGRAPRPSPMGRVGAQHHRAGTRPPGPPPGRRYYGAASRPLRGQVVARRVTAAWFGHVTRWFLRERQLHLYPSGAWRRRRGRPFAGPLHTFGRAGFKGRNTDLLRGIVFVTRRPRTGRRTE